MQPTPESDNNASSPQPIEQATQLPQEPEPKSPTLPEHSLAPIIQDLWHYGELNLLAGPTGSGKTTFLCHLLEQISLGNPTLGKPTHPPRYIGYITTDRPWAEHTRTIAKFSLPPTFYNYSMVDDLEISGRVLRGTAKDGRKSRFDLFMHCIEGLHRSGLPSLKGALIVVDVAAYFLGGDLLSYDRVMSHMFDLNRFAADAQCCLLGILHSPKPRGGPDNPDRYVRYQDRIAGTTAIGGSASTVMYLAIGEETPSGEPLIACYPRHIAHFECPLGWDNAGHLLPVNPQIQTSNALLSLFTSPETIVSSQDIFNWATQEKLTIRTAQRYLASLLAEGIIEKVSRGRYRLAPQDQAPQ
jgi:hypothetical protein